MSRYAAMFRHAGNAGVFGAFVMLGDPDLARCAAILDRLVEAEADMLEVGIPFSDPIADGPVIQAAAVKLEGGESMAETIAFLSKRGIPVVGHVGLTPQAVNALGGYRARGRDEAEAAKVIADARAVADAGSFAIVIEGVMEEIAAEATKAVACPTIGIGASVSCDGQILVTEDMMGLFERTPRFVKRFGDLASEISAAAASYAADVKSRAFPTDEQIYRGKK